MLRFTFKFPTLYALKNDNCFCMFWDVGGMCWFSTYLTWTYFPVFTDKAAFIKYPPCWHQSHHRLQCLPSFKMRYRVISKPNNVAWIEISRCWMYRFNKNRQWYKIPYRRDIYKPLNRKSSWLVRVAAPSGLHPYGIAKECSKNIVLI